MGGWANEREVSLMSGKGVADALEGAGHRVTRIDMDRDVAARIAEAAPDVVFNALHGVPGEDGTVQGMLDLMGIPYTHSGLATSVIAIDKELTKQALVPHGIPMPGGRDRAVAKNCTSATRLPRPYVLKPVNEGSSVGVAIVTDESNYGNPISRDAKGRGRNSTTLLAEPFIRGRELTTAVIDTPQGPRALGVTELVVGKRVLRFRAKYTDGMTEHVCPGADSRRKSTGCASNMRCRRTDVLGCRGVQPVRFPLGRRARRGRAVPAGNQHPAGHDPAQPRARTGALLRHRICRACRDDRRGRAAARGQA